MNRKDRRARDKISRSTASSGASARFSTNGVQERERFVRGAQTPPGAMVSWSDDGKSLPAIVLDRKCMQRAPGLQRLFDLHKQIGTVALHQQIAGTGEWTALAVPGKPEVSLVKLTLILDAPHRVRTELLLNIGESVPALQAAATGQLIGLISPEGIAEMQTSGVPDDFPDFLDRCVIVSTPAGSVLSVALEKTGA